MILMIGEVRPMKTLTTTTPPTVTATSNFAPSGMPVEHEQMISVLCVVMYFTRFASHENVQRENGRRARKVLLQELRKLGLRGRHRVSLRVMFAVWQILELMRPANREHLTTIRSIHNAAARGLELPKLAKMNPHTWSEQIAGRANLMARSTWPELDFR